jgi:hypothetical protein
MQFEKNTGYWQVAGQYYRNKVVAIMAAQHRNLGPYDISFHYNDPWWSQARWDVEPEQSLPELYAKRARQLREKYKTIIIRFSGGADSTNIIRTFVDNGIKIDVIALNTWLQPDTHFELSTQNIEKKLITLPYVDKLKEQGVEFELVVNDYYPTIEILGDDPAWIFDIDAPRFNLMDICAHRALTTKEFDRWDDESTAVVAGIDKPKVFMREGKIWFWSQGDSWHSLINKANRMTPEPFYWTADMPEIPIKQSHVVKNFFKSHPELLSTHDGKLFRAGSKQNLIPLIYPAYYGHWDPTQNKMPEWDHDDILLRYRNYKSSAPRGNGTDWQFHKSPYFKVWKDGIDLADRLIDRKFKNENSIWDDGLQLLLSKPRWLGK